ncbi:uncharacterized protein G6M90_00g083280 [Metarhizium brunneum]|uniref:Uncharacterized protein n=1 Tax=Metarhizium brunneum TaxID=500148 RepID=A0A7D5Z244_9HYPO|nr:hypothetical protein G6M90_00g083280 [Metarhizium brunneum]
MNEAIEEECLTGDRLEYFHHTQPGQVLDGRFKIIFKLGYGSSSTVWLAENLKFKKWCKSSIPRYVSIKVAALDTDASREAAHSKSIAEADPSHEGISFIRLPLESSSYTHRKGVISASFLSQCERPYLTFNADSPGIGYHYSYSSSTSFVSLKL